MTGPPSIDLIKDPYPYKCAFTICNDCDYITREAFEVIHQFINTTDDTRLGKGLGLPIADTMFMYSERPEGLSYFKGTSGIPGKHSGFLREAVKRGWIDSLHGYGDFVKPNAFSRKMAERALNELDKKDIKLKTWIDHGSGDNSQNFSIPNLFSKGDNPKHSAYHTDLLKEYGVIFVAGYNTDLIGQNGKRKYLSKPLKQSEVPYKLSKRMQGRLWGRRLLRTKRGNDHNMFHYFSRARNGVLRPDASTLSHQLSDENIAKLIDSEGTMILYQHLGAIKRNPNPYPYLDPQAIRALSNIAKKHHDKTIWVAPTSELLAYTYLLENIELEVIHSEDSLTIEIIHKDYVGKQFDSAELQNLSFRIRDYRRDKIILKCGDYTFKDTEYETFNDRGIVIKLNPGQHN